jgi:hypothetical protein
MNQVSFITRNSTKIIKIGITDVHKHKLYVTEDDSEGVVGGNRGAVALLPSKDIFTFHSELIQGKYYLTEFAKRDPAVDKTAIADREREIIEGNTFYYLKDEADAAMAGMAAFIQTNGGSMLYSALGLTNAIHFTLATMLRFHR